MERLERREKKEEEEKKKESEGRSLPTTESGREENERSFVDAKFMWGKKI